MILLRELKLAELEQYAYWQQPHHSYHAYNGPYFKKKLATAVQEDITQLTQILLGKSNKQLPHGIPIVISNEQGDLLGEVNWYWKSAETNWLEVGLVIFDENNWGKGMGAIALRLWITKVFERQPSIVRIGISTWSGNTGMMKLSEKLGLQREAVYKKARIVNGQYYDSVSYGILKEDWFAQQS